ncbi:unnamed protein product [Ambrosiozyma monospora]|uniref:Unnamed protein product n=1 Tax=Ambrosiozyma monospora TaxID=43982 RepID=A0ACB5TMG7_AMBMO|nr:unnamed protein product [Ambrosiozyma monospora]
MPITEEVMLKTSLKMSISKLEFKTSKMKQLNKIKLTEISKDLKQIPPTTSTNRLDSRKFERNLTLVKIKIQKLINDDNQIDLFEILTVDLQLMLSKLPQLCSIRHNNRTGAIESHNPLLLGGGVVDQQLVHLVKRSLSGKCSMIVLSRSLD